MPPHSVFRASKLLFISQSAVSQSIKVLEKKLGITLFIRSTKRVQLTPEGETLLRHVEPAINLIARGEAQIMEAGTLGGGQLRIGASDTICRYFLVPYLNRFHRSFPNVHIKVTNQTSTQCVDLLESGQVDFIVTNYPKLASFQPSSHDSDSFVPRYLHRERRILPGTGKQAGSLKRAAAVPDSDARPQEYDE